MEVYRIRAESGAIPEAVDWLTEALKRRRAGSKERSRAILMAEEVLVKLIGHAAPGAEAKLAVMSRMGSLSLRISVPGEEFEFSRDVDFCLDMDLEGEDSQAEASIRDLLLNAFRDKLRYRHRGGCNIVQIAVKESERRLLYWTASALLASIVLGLLLRELLSPAAAQGLNDWVLSPVKTMFLNALKMIVAPVVFFSILSCVSQFRDLSDFGRTGAKVMGFYMFTTLAAIAMGAAVFWLLKPGEAGSQAASAAVQAAADAGGADISILDTIVNIVPSNIIAPFVDSDMLQIIFIAILCGAAVGMVGEYSKPLRDFFEACNSLFLKVTTIIVSVIPLAVFCSICSLVMLTGTDTLLSLLYFLVTAAAGMAGMIAVYCLLILLVARLENQLDMETYKRRG